ncbi:MAG: type II toxin-antitoxin system RelE/ParE family toxin [Chthoniobacteraceae bacterium]
MESFSIQWRNSTKKDIRNLPRQEVPRIIAAAVELANNPMPNGSQKLSGSERTHRVRVGDYRIVYEVFADSQIVEIQRIRHRKDVYRE